MGSIFSKPKMPSAPPVPVITTPIVTPPTPTKTDPDNPPAGTGGDNTDNAPEVTPDEQRVQNILARSRGRQGTIATSFNGILNNETNNIPVRKTLLGE